MHPRPPPRERAGSQSCAYTSSPLRTTIDPSIVYCHYIVSDPQPSESETGLPDEMENAGLLARDAALYGTTFTDVTGRRIDPAKIRPSTGPGGFLGDPDMRLGETRDVTADLVGLLEGDRPAWADADGKTVPPIADEECEYCRAEEACGCKADGVECRCGCGRCRFPGPLPDDGPDDGVLRPDAVFDGAIPLEDLPVFSRRSGGWPLPPIDDQRPPRGDR